MTTPASQAQRVAQAVAIVVLSAVTLVGFAAPFLPSSVTENLAPWLDTAKDSAWAPPLAILSYVALASIGVPQIVLITALVATFGPWTGFACAWTGKVIACSLGFWVGRRFGADIVARNAGPRLTKIMQQFARHGFLVSALIRMVPTVPSVLINIAAGATPIKFSDFLAGTALGSIPKMALLAFGGAAAMSAVHANNIWTWAILAAVIVAWVLIGLVGRRWLNRAD